MFQYPTVRTLAAVCVCVLVMAVAGCGDSEKVHESWVAPPEAGASYDDNVISANIVARISAIPELSNLDLHVRVTNGEVFLSGMANNQEQVDQAVMQAWLVDGFQKMNKEIVLSGAR